jgi:hypothetical protein
LTHDVLGNASEEQMREPSPPMGPHDDHARADFLCSRKDFRGGVALTENRPEATSF